MVYVGSNDGYVYALNATTGALAWRYNIGIVEGSPVVSQGIVYVGSGMCYFYALNAKTGKLIWRFSHDITSSGCDHPIGTPAVFNGIVYVAGFSTNSMYALDAKTGAIIWQTQLSGYSSPVIVNGTLYTGPYALNASTGEILWRANIDSLIINESGQPVVAYGMVYLSTGFGDLGDDLYAIDEKTGAIRWIVPGDFEFSSPYAYKGMVYIGSYDYYGNGPHNALSALNARTGALIWLYQAGGPIVATPTIANGIVYFGSYDKYLYALYANNGTLDWRHKTGGIVFSPLVH